MGVFLICDQTGSKKLSLILYDQRELFCTRNRQPTVDKFDSFPITIKSIVYGLFSNYFLIALPHLPGRRLVNGLFFGIWLPRFH